MRLNHHQNFVRAWASTELATHNLAGKDLTAQSEPYLKSMISCVVCCDNMDGIFCHREVSDSYVHAWQWELSLLCRYTQFWWLLCILINVEVCSHVNHHQALKSLWLHAQSRLAPRNGSECIPNISWCQRCLKLQNAMTFPHQHKNIPYETQNTGSSQTDIIWKPEEPVSHQERFKVKSHNGQLEETSWRRKNSKSQPWHAEISKDIKKRDAPITAINDQSPDGICPHLTNCVQVGKLSTISADSTKLHPQWSTFNFQ